MRTIISYRLSVIGYRLSVYCSLLTAYCLLSTISCKPERDNPYDPQSPNYIREGKVKGKVTNMVGVSLEGVKISTIPIKFNAITDSKGEFVLNSEPGTWKLVAELLDYVSDTTQVDINVGDTTIVNFQLNGIPVVQSACVVSCHEHSGGKSIYWAQVTALVQDPDGIQDIDSVRFLVQLDTAEFTKYLSFNPTTGMYDITICERPYPNKELENLVGRPFIVYAIDKKETIGNSPNFYIPRIIYELPYPVRPLNGDTLPQSTPIDFVWIGIKPIYHIVYRLIIRDWSSSDIILTLDNIPDTTVTVDSLLQATYRWKVEAIDDFGDFSRSKGISFVVQ